MGDYDKAFQVIEERHQLEVKALQDEIKRLQSELAKSKPAAPVVSAAPVLPPPLPKVVVKPHLVESKKAPPKKKSAHK